MADSEVTIFLQASKETGHRENREALSLLHRNALTGNIMGVFATAGARFRFGPLHFHLYQSLTGGIESGYSTTR